MKLSLLAQFKSLCESKLNWKVHSFRKRRKRSRHKLEFGKLEPRSLLAVGAPAPIATVTPEPIALVQSASNTQEIESLESDHFTRDQIIWGFYQKYPDDTKLEHFANSGGGLYFREIYWDSNYKRYNQPIAEEYPNVGDVILIDPDVESLDDAVVMLKTQLDLLHKDKYSHTYQTNPNNDPVAPDPGSDGIFTSGWDPGLGVKVWANDDWTGPIGNTVTFVGHLDPETGWVKLAANGRWTTMSVLNRHAESFSTDWSTFGDDTNSFPGDLDVSNRNEVLKWFESNLQPSNGLPLFGASCLQEFAGQSLGRESKLVATAQSSMRTSLTRSKPGSIIAVELIKQLRDNYALGGFEPLSGIKNRSRSHLVWKLSQQSQTDQEPKDLVCV